MHEVEMSWASVVLRKATESEPQLDPQAATAAANSDETVREAISTFIEKKCKALESHLLATSDFLSDLDLCLAREIASWPA